MDRASMMMEPMESRRLLSASATLLSDRAAIAADIAAGAATAAAQGVIVAADHAVLKADDIRANTTIEPLLLQLHNDYVYWTDKLASSVATQQANVAAAQAVVLAEKAKIVSDANAGATVLAADQRQLTNDKIAVQQAYTAGLQARLADRADAAAAFTTDDNAITAALPGSGLTSTEKTAVTTFIDAKATAFADGTSAHETTLAAREKLITDLQATL
jgi:hypothetical protein